MGDALLVEIQAFRPGQLADVLAQVGLAPAHQAEAVLHLRAAGEDIPGRPLQQDRHRRVAPRPAQQSRPAPHHPGHRVVHPGDDLPVVEEKEVCQTAEPGERLVIARADRLVAEVAAGHDEHRRGERLGQEQVVERRVGEHHPENTQARGHLRGQVGHWEPVEQHDGVLGRGEQFGLGRCHPAESLGCGQIRDHHGQRFARPVFAHPQALHCRGRARVHGQVEAAQSLDGHHRAGRQGRGRLGQGIAGKRPSVHVVPAELRPAHRAGIGLGVEAAVQGVMVLAPAVIAQGEHAHGGVRPVVGDVFDDGEAGAAVGAVGKGVAEAAVVRVADIGQAVNTGGDVRGDLGARRPAAVACQDAEIRARRRFGRFDAHLADARHRRRLGAQPGHKLFHCRGRAGQMNIHTLAVVGHGPPHPQAQGQPVDKGPETHALDNAAHRDPAGCGLGGRRRHGRVYGFFAKVSASGSVPAPWPSTTAV